MLLKERNRPEFSIQKLSEMNKSTKLEVLIYLTHFIASLVSGIRRGLVVSVGDLEPGVPGSIPSSGAMVMMECLGQGTFPSLALVCLPRDHE